MNITLTHNTPNVSLATLEIDLEGLDRYDYAEMIEEWQDRIRDAMGYDEDAEDAPEKPVIDYQVDSYEGIPKHLMTETGPSRAAWDYLEAMASDNSRCEPEVYWAAESLGIPASDVREAYEGQFNSDEEFAQAWADNMGLIPDDPLTWPYNCVSWPDAARELMTDYVTEDGWYFRIM